MFKTIAGIICFLFFAWDVSGQNINEIPMFGGAEKTPAQIQADKAFIEEVEKKAPSREAAASTVIQLGWETFFKGDPKKAIRRFNQAWLLTPENPYVFWGFGVTSGALDNFDESIRFLTQAVKMMPTNAKAINDLGYSCLWKGLKKAGAENEKKGLLKQALENFDKAKSIDPKFEPIYQNLAIFFFFQEDYAKAWENIFHAEKLGGRFIDPRLVEDLSKKMPRPKTP